MTSSVLSRLRIYNLFPATTAIFSSLDCAFYLGIASDFFMLFSPLNFFLYYCKKWREYEVLVQPHFCSFFVSFFLLKILVYNLHSICYVFYQFASLLFFFIAGFSFSGPNMSGTMNCCCIVSCYIQIYIVVNHFSPPLEAMSRSLILNSHVFVVVFSTN